MAKFDPILERCPTCGAKGNCTPHSSYERMVVDYWEGKVEECHLKITRVICSCGHTHAIIPDSLIPYAQFSLAFVLHVLKLHLSHAMTVDGICQDYGITPPTLYRWQKAFRQHMAWWLGRTASERMARLAFLEELSSLEPASPFTMGFYRKTLSSFLQTHANPANCRRLPKGWPSLSAPAT